MLLASLIDLVAEDVSDRLALDDIFVLVDFIWFALTLRFKFAESNYSGSFICESFSTPHPPASPLSPLYQTNLSVGKLARFLRA